MSTRVKRVEFTKDMRDYTILCPDMLPVHFALLEKVFMNFGYNLKVLKNQGRSVVESGLRNVHNDTCYPALLVIGQLIDALESGEYDINKVALMITQTGGGCRASNYIHLLRKALIKSGYGHVPVISLNAGSMEKNSGFRLSIPMLRQSAAIIVYGDILMLLKNQVKPYEINHGDTDALVDKWVVELANQLEVRRGVQLAELKSNLREIVTSFNSVQRVHNDKTKVGIVGEIYVKYSSLGNNGLENFLISEGCEVMVPGLLGFLMYCMENGVIDYQLYGGSYFKSFFLRKVNEYLGKLEELIIDSVKTYSNFIAPSPFVHMKELVKDIIGLGCKMGEGWFLPAEMVELIKSGYGNIVVTQPFGCLPNHIVGKGIVANIKAKYPEANIVPIDYDPGATRVNQENRIKLMLAVAREKVLPDLPKEEEELQLGFQNWVLML